jgi:hypothetical protein
MLRERLSKSPGLRTYYTIRQHRQPERSTESFKNFRMKHEDNVVRPADRILYKNSERILNKHNIKNVSIEHRPNDVSGRSMVENENGFNRISVLRGTSKTVATYHEIGHVVLGHGSSDNEVFRGNKETYQDEVDAWNFARKEFKNLPQSERTALLKDKVRSLNTYRKAYGMRQHRRLW